MGTPDTLGTGQVGQQRDGLDRLPQAHLVGQDSVQTSSVHRREPIQADVLVRTERELCVEEVRSRDVGSTRLGVGRVEASSHVGSGGGLVVSAAATLARLAGDRSGARELRGQIARVLLGLFDEMHEMTVHSLALLGLPLQALLVADDLVDFEPESLDQLRDASRQPLDRGLVLLVLPLALPARRFQASFLSFADGAPLEAFKVLEDALAELFSQRRVPLALGLEV